MTITGACIVNMVGGYVPQFCGGTAVQNPILGALEANKLMVFEEVWKGCSRMLAIGELLWR